MGSTGDSPVPVGDSPTGTTAANLDVHAEVRAHVKGRLNVDELQPAGLFDLAAERAAFEGREDELVVAPDEFVGPALDLPAAGVQAQFLVGALFLARLVNVFQGLERETRSTSGSWNPCYPKARAKGCPSL